ncbi:helix-turn-helix domain-containing protein [Burkholderia anthina]|uniref:helix-turn-helix domain-containing protein n=1 Tax=Burkholderia anthina TaxID=179879 RepID=UPI0037C88D38
MAAPGQLGLSRREAERWPIRATSHISTEASSTEAWHTDMYREEDDVGLRIRTPLTHEQVSSLTGTSHVTVTRTITRLKSEGVIQNEDQHFWVLDQRRLKT